MKYFNVAVSVILTGLPLVDVRADVLWDNGEWDGDSADPSERNTKIPDAWTIDDVVFTSEVIIEEYEWFSVMTDDLDPIAADFIVLDSELNKVAVLTDLDFTREFLFEIDGASVYRMTISDLTVNLAAGHYVLGGRPVGMGEGRAFSASNQTILGESEALFRSECFGFEDWVPVSEIRGSPKDLAFIVSGTVVPVPAAIAVVLALPVAARSRRRP